MSLPLPTETQAFCIVSALESGFLTCANKYIIQPFEPNSTITMPSLSFLLQHSTKKDKLLFDLGIRRDVETLPPLVYQQLQSISPTEIPQTVVESLAKGGLTPDDIEHVVLSHVHWDHIGNPELFPKSTFILAEEGRDLIASAYPGNPSSTFLTDVPPKEQTRYLPTLPQDGSSSDETAVWKPVGPFPHTYDFYGDGSLYIVDSPGHLPGHLNILARTSNDGSWILLAGDSVHHGRILDGSAKVAVGVDDNPHFCIHQDLAKAEEHIERIKKFKTLPRTQVLITHDAQWYETNAGGSAFFPGTIPPAGIWA